MISWEVASTHLISPVQPAYPRGAMAERRSGAVMLQVEISPERTGTDARVLVGADDFAESAMAAVMQSQRFLSITDCDAEPTGIYFSPTGRSLYINVQHRGGTDSRDFGLAIQRFSDGRFSRGDESRARP